MERIDIKAIAAYLPQFHPIPENDLWWGKGFTEWTNVTKAKPLFKGHWQPRLPSDLGFYDLRVPESRIAQAELAKQFGIHGFCYWHYWFGGRRIIEHPFIEVVKTGQPDFPFCIAWANQTWSGTWHGLSSNEILIEQTYPGEEDYVAHFYALLEAFSDKRYIEVHGKKLVFIFRPHEIPDPKKFIDCWQELAIKEGFKGIHFVGMHMPVDWDPKADGYDAMIAGFLQRDRYRKSINTPYKRITDKFKKISGKLQPLPDIISYSNYVKNYPELSLRNDQYPWILADWDNTPRAGANGWLFDGATPELFGELCTRAFQETGNKSADEKIVMVRSWNEWAEGNYLEPDAKNGTRYLEEFQKSLQAYSKKQSS